MPWGCKMGEEIFHPREVRVSFGGETELPGHIVVRVYLAFATGDIELNFTFGHYQNDYSPKEYH